MRAIGGSLVQVMLAGSCRTGTLIAAGVALCLGLALAPSHAHAMTPETLSEIGINPLTAVGVAITAGSVIFCTLAAILFLRAAQAKRLAEAAAKQEVREIARERRSLQALLGSEPQAMVRWSQDGSPELCIASLAASTGLPDSADKVLDFPTWLDSGHAKSLAAKVAMLRKTGERFDIGVETASGRRLRAEGQASQGNALLKLTEDAKPVPQGGGDAATLKSDISLALYDAIPMPVWFRDGDGRLSWINAAYARAVDVSDKAEVYDQQLEFLSSRQRDAAVQKLEKGETYSARVHAIVSGAKRAFEVVVQPVGVVSAGIAIDVAALESAETELSRHIEEHTRTLDNITTAVAIFAPDKRLDYFNQAFADLWNLDTDWLATKPDDGEILDKLRRDRALPEEPDYKAWKQKRLARYDETSSHEERWHLPDGRTVHVIANHVSGGSATVLYDNITEELDLKSRLNRLNHVQKETLDHMREGVAVFGTDGRLKLFNPSFATVWKLDADALSDEPHIDEVVGWCRALLDDDEAWNTVKRTITSIDDERSALHGTLTRPDDVILAYASLPLPDGATLLTYLDITDSKRVEKALMDRNEALEAADQLKGAFIGHVSYELRTPLTNIIGFSEMLASEVPGTLTDNQRDYLNDIQSSSDELLTIINEILDLATIDAGTFDLSVAPVKVADLVDAALKGVREKMRLAGVESKVNIAKDAQEIVADGKRLTQVLFNLLSNAVGFSEAGGIVKVNCRRDGPAIAISVEDTGRGIPEDYQESAFNPFETQSQGSDHRGTGLGLTIVKSLVELHGGSVALASTPGVGTTVTIQIPDKASPKAETNLDTGEAILPPAATG